MNLSGKSLLTVVTKLILLVILPVGLILAYGKTTKSLSTTLKPKSCRDSAAISVENKKLTYYSLYRDEPITLEVSGPKRLRVITRLDFDSPVSAERTYTIKVFMDDDQEGLAFKKSAKPSLLSTFVDVEGRTPGKIRNIYLDIPEGRHTLVFSLETNKLDWAVRLRFLVEKQSPQALLERKAKQWNFIAPKEYKDKVALYVENNKRDYFRFSKGLPLQVNAQGPAALKLLTRLEFNDMMGQASDYKISVFEDDNFKSEHFFQVKRATKVVYSEDKGLQTGIKGVFLLEVPHGEHNYRLELAEPRDASILCRPFIKISSKEMGKKEEGENE
ncbi:MAG: hypothetical protein JW714_05710 [Candidatus Omnitrophica bacterium]|nr:hypothetical protein [Candidatus Omnitrophota bacterium]